MNTRIAVPIESLPAISPEVRQRADTCIRNHVLAAMGIGLIPSFVIEVAGVTGIEVKLIQDLARIYSFPVPGKLIAYKILISLILTVGPLYLAVRMQSAVKSVPVLGHAAYAGFMAVSNGAAVYAVGKIFQKHYESGGTFLGRGSGEIRQAFADNLSDGKKVVPTFVANHGR